MPLSNQKSDYYQYDESLGGLLVGTVQVYSFVDNKTFSSNTEYSSTLLASRAKV